MFYLVCHQEYDVYTYLKRHNQNKHNIVDKRGFIEVKYDISIKYKFFLDL